jgi:hypothetical protein
MTSTFSITPIPPAQIVGVVQTDKPELSGFLVQLPWKTMVQFTFMCKLRLEFAASKLRRGLLDIALLFG